MGLPTIEPLRPAFFGLDLGDWGFPASTSSMAAHIVSLRIKQDHGTPMEMRFTLNMFFLPR